MSQSSEAVKVIVRCRPVNEREERLHCEVVLYMDPSIVQVQLVKPKAGDKTPPKVFSFDGVYYMEDTTQGIYDDICFPLVTGVLEGYNGTVFAYGQTGCGKSYTMMGVEEPSANRGIIPRAFQHLFDHMAVREGTKYLLQASYLEIYNEEVRDLLGRDVKKKLDLHEHPEKGVYVQSLSHHQVHNVRDLERVMELGSKSRSVGATLMNVDSSRSHSIFTIDVEIMELEDDGKEHLKAGRLNLVDLAGSERQSKTGSTGDRLKEATKINLSLSALGNVISALVDSKSTHIPYRDSKLTRLLQSSLGGNTKTLMIACVSPADNNYDETLSTLRYANRAKNIKNKPRINEDPKDALLRQYREEIEKLKKMLGQTELPASSEGAQQSFSRSPVPPPPPPPARLSEDQLRALEEEKEAIRREYEARVSELLSLYSKEQADRAELQDELDRLQDSYQSKLDAAQEQHESTAETSSTTTGFTAVGSGETSVFATSEALEAQEREEERREGDRGEIPLDSSGRTPASSMVSPVAAEATNMASPVHAGTTSNQSSALVVGGTDDRKALREHEEALQRLEELQNSMVGGEKAGDTVLRDQLEKKRELAEGRLEMWRASSMLEDEDDGIMERIFNSMTEEVRVKSKVLERVQAKLHSATEDIKDLSTEFELDRQDYLDTIRTQQRQLQLQEQLLQTVVPLLRRDCNYFNIDKIRAGCSWDKDTQCWILPKVTVTKTSLSPANSKVALLERRSVPSQQPSKQAVGVMTGFGASDFKPAKTSGSFSTTLTPHVKNTLSHVSSSGAGLIVEEEEEDRFRLHLQRSGESDYFKPKRAAELLAGGSQLRESDYGEGRGRVTRSGSLPLHPSKSSAATVHGVNSLIAADPHFAKRPGRLQALAVSPSLPRHFDSVPMQDPGKANIQMLEKVEKRISSRKRNSLEPLHDTGKPRRPPL